MLPVTFGVAGFFVSAERGVVYGAARRSRHAVERCQPETAGSVSHPRRPVRRPRRRQGRPRSEERRVGKESRSRGARSDVTKQYSINEQKERMAMMKSEQSTTRAMRRADT